MIGMAVALVVAGGTMDTARAATAPAEPFEGFGPAGVVALTHGHSHNDYTRNRPLADALSRGFTSVEVDVVLVGGQLLVGHDLVEALVSGSTLRSAYLDPLADWVARNGGKVYAPGDPPLTLLVDIKSEAKSTWRALEGILTDYEAMLTRFTPEGVEPGAVTVLVSGNRPVELIAERSQRFTALDGRISDLDGTAPETLIPLISARWGALFSWSGKGRMPAADAARLRALVETAHSQGRRIRFYATPASTPGIRANVWRAELEAGVDLLNVDHLTEAQRFLMSASNDGPAADTGRSGAGHRLPAGGVSRTP
ncbi:phosphatidylinositol-specific phospholipase C/glycerophosphodiester phosphodiesterase family protein [Sporichthya polymorpha]|uniref:phosphatidylinositol-specific phospholipase C/glycerophosphodiester phosphodiesterase family protein n=1 Tax=Sporichthya polymorpha TaxID=35751 RepID=UPI0006881850|nr:phosphatidylinositol-specific phospholipase C/glycerophosphodiester phosphodiesterase family protein [Sporichthya polymorpha]